MAEGKRVLFVSEKMAALDVVHRRLQQVGLGDFCLELHSHKSNKKEVLRSLGAALDRKSQRTAERFAKESARLDSLRAKLNAHAEALHRVHPSGFTVYRATGRLGELTRAPDVHVPILDAPRLTEDRVRELQEAATIFAARGRAVEPVAQHPRRHARRAGWSALDEDGIFEALGRASAALERTARAATAVEETLELRGPRCLAGLQQLAALTAAAGEGPLPGAATESSWTEKARRARTWLADDARHRGEEQALLERWTPALFQEDLEQASSRFTRWAGAFFLLAWLLLFSPRRALRALHRHALPDNASVRNDLRKALAVRNEGSRLEMERSGLLPLLDADVLDRGAALHATVLLPLEALHDLAGRSAAFSPDRRALLTTRARELDAAVEALAAAERRVRELAIIPAGSAWPLSDDSSQLERLRGALDMLRQARRSFREGCLYHEAVAALGALGHGALAQAHAAGQLSAEQVPAALERNLLSRWLAAVVDHEEVLRTFDAVGQQRTVEEFRTLDRQHLELSREYVVARLEARLPPARRC